MRILVTGGCGFIGTATVSKLLEEQNQVDVVRYQSEPANPEICKVIDFNEIPETEFSKYDAVIHLMANNDTQSSDTDQMFKANVDYPKIVFERTYQAGCRNFVYASSTAVYGNSKVPYKENSKLDPLTPYAESKIEFDKWAIDFSEKAKVIGLRYCNVYGPGEERKGKRKSMIGQLISQINAGDTPTLFQYGEQERDWVYIKDVVNANMLSLLSPKTGIYNIGSGVSSSFNTIVDLIFEHYKREKTLNYIPCPFENTYQSKTLCDIKKAREELNFFPSFDLRNGIEDYITSLTCEN